MKKIILICLVVISLGNLNLVRAQFFRPVVVNPIVVNPPVVVNRPIVYNSPVVANPAVQVNHVNQIYVSNNEYNSDINIHSNIDDDSDIDIRDAKENTNIFEKNAVRCLITRNNSAIISCRSPSSVIECPISVEMSVFENQNFTFFGLSRNVSMNYSSIIPERHEYFMYPRCQESSRWLNTSQPCNDGNTNQDIKLCYSKNKCNGIRVNDIDCFTDLSNLFWSSAHKSILPVNGTKCECFGFVKFI